LLEAKSNKMKKQNKQKTFIVDDDPFWIAMLTEILEELGITDIETFDNGNDCLANLHHNPSLVFLDYQMEDMDGLEVLNKIKSYYPRIGVIFCTALEDLSVAVSAMNQGSFDYLLKSNATKKEVAGIIKQISEHQALPIKLY